MPPINSAGMKNTRGGHAPTAKKRIERELSNGPERIGHARFPGGFTSGRRLVAGKAKKKRERALPFRHASEQHRINCSFSAARRLHTTASPLRRRPPPPPLSLFHPNPTRIFCRGDFPFPQTDLAALTIAVVSALTPKSLSVLFYRLKGKVYLELDFSRKKGFFSISIDPQLKITIL